MAMRRKDKNQRVKKKGEKLRNKREEEKEGRAGDNRNETGFVLCLWLYRDEKI